MKNPPPVKLVRVRDPVPGATRTTAGPTLEVSKVGAIELGNVGVVYHLDGVPMVVPWPSVRWVECQKPEPKKADPKGE